MAARIEEKFGTNIHILAVPPGYVLYVSEGDYPVNQISFKYCSDKRQSRGLILDGYLAEPMWEEACRGINDDSDSSTLGTRSTEFNGSYNLFLWEKRNAAQEVLVANDRLGFRNLYYWISKDESKVVFASTLSLMKIAIPELRPNLKAFGQQILFSAVINGESLLEDVHKLPPGSVISIGPRGVMLRAEITGFSWGDEYYDLPIDDVAKMIVELGVEVVRTWVGAQDVTVSLSGGYDSRFLTLLATKCAKSVNAVNLGTPDWIDTVLAEQFCSIVRLPLYICTPPSDLNVADYISIMHTVEHVSDYLSPFWLKKYADSFDKDRVVLNGFFGGPLTGSAIKWVKGGEIGWSKSVSCWCREINRCNLPVEGLEKVCALNVQHLQEHFENELRINEPNRTFESFQKLTTLEWRIRQSGFVSQDTYNLFRHFSQVAVPFIDHRLLHLFTNIPRGFLEGQGAYLRAIAMLDASGVEFASTSSKLLHPSTYTKGPRALIEQTFATIINDFEEYVTDHWQLLSAFFMVDRLTKLLFDDSQSKIPALSIPHRLILLNAAILLIGYSQDNG